MLGKSIRRRVLLALVFLALVPLIAVAYQGYHCGRMAVSDLMRLHVISVTQARHTIISNWLDERIADISALVRLPILVEQVERLRAGTDPTAQAVLQGIVESVQTFEAPFENVTLFDARWVPLATSGTGHHGNGDFATATFREGVQNSESVFFDEVHLHEGKEAGAHAGRAIRNREGTVIGYLVANLNLTRSLTPILQERSGLWHTGKSYLMDGGGQVITEPFPEGKKFAFAASGSPMQLRERRVDAPEVHAYKDFLGHEVIGAAAPLPIHDWTLAVEINKEEATEWVQVLLFRVSLMVTIALGAVLAASAWMSGQLGSPLARLAEVAHRISQGHTEERVGPMQVAEAEEVRRAVNQMLDELREKEAELVSAATLATVGELTSSVVHEMRNPLSSIKMNLQSLQYAKPGDEQNRELTQIAFEQAGRLEAMLNELLQYGRPLVLEREPADPMLIVESAAALLENKAKEFGVRIEITDELQGASVSIDVEQMRRALVNLIQNAIEISPRDAVVEVRIGHSAQFSGGVALSILDHGPGFRPGQIDKLFRPFFTTKSNGIGLGLANVKKIVTLHGGLVEARERTERGASFHIDLP